MTSSSETSRLSGRPAWAFDRRIFLNGMRDGVPIALGYFACFPFPSASLQETQV